MSLKCLDASAEYYRVRADDAAERKAYAVLVKLRDVLDAVKASIADARRRGRDRVRIEADDE